MQHMSGEKQRAKHEYASTRIIQPAAENCAQHVADALQDLGAARGARFDRPAASDVVRARRILRRSNLLLDELLSNLFERSS